MEISPGKQLFIDDFFIESMQGVRRALNEPEKLTVDAPLITPLNKPWERERLQFSGVSYDEQRQGFRAYATAWIGNETLICAFDSDDGVKWARPNLGLVEFEGSTANNITNCPPGGMGMFWDPHEQDEAFRWKRIDNKPTGQDPDGAPVWRAFHSADGCDWTSYPPGPHNKQKMMFNFGSPGDTFGGVINPDARYALYSQRGSGRRTRVLGRRDSEDYLNWSGLRTVIDQDLADLPGTEFYSAGYDPANRTDGGLHILMLHAFQTDLTEPYLIDHPDQYWGGEEGPHAIAVRIDGFLDSQLAVSRDTVAWTRYRTPFIRRGAPGAWDWGMLFAHGPILHDGRLLFFYGGFSQTHNKRIPQLWKRPHGEKKIWGLGLATLRPDGYVSLEAESFASGIVTTHRFRQQAGGTVRVNVDAAAGELLYELQDCTGKPMPGYTLGDCDPIRTDDMAAPLSWNGQATWPGVDDARRAEVPGLQDGEFYVKLMFQIAPGTKLYSLTLDPPEVALWKTRLRGRIE